MTLSGSDKGFGYFCALIARRPASILGRMEK